MNRTRRRASAPRPGDSLAATELLALALTLTAAFAHAGWNLLAKQAGGGVAVVWSFGAAATVLWTLPGLAALVLAGGRVDPALIGFAALSGALHAGYFLLLQRGYASGDLSVVYPLARGTGPLLAVPLAALLLAERPTAGDLIGALVIVGSIIALTGRPRPGDGATVGFALATGVLIASYTIWDANAVGRITVSVVTYYWLTELFRTALLTPLALGRRADVTGFWRTHRRTILGVAILSPLAYILVLAALQLATVALVAPVRELSIVIGALAGTVLLGEPAGRRRVLSAAGVVVGVVVLAL